MPFCCTSYEQDHSRKVFIDYAAVIIRDTTYDHLVYFIDFAGPSFRQYLVAVNICGMIIVFMQFVYASGLRPWMEV